ncbi:indolepyruvate ferredoxin oxidoreductase family protein [Noviherbaspirillum sedimenti]|uniref:Indolepyruvate ferredoxin oxidoreductase family protein n=1 Tax=Noviherbaspirillum sedimenti TaxID=2320865 RepID=A0A3A3G083_9BURK|nr:indolepyruvate ferredoxin oxidoreductase family protein [Noviherbaspirillum sedimenti]RJG01843.1 indolepyruvate ferredoxin oxidoreductase family protein [Noviherbaspirillum sedimenti]
MRNVTLDDKYICENGSVLMSGIQALVRLPLLQRGIDRSAGLNTAGFISGYRGSPLGSYDLDLWRARKLLEKNDIVFQPGVNEDLAATAVWGTQMLATTPQANKDGVFAIWYGKGPGVDRSCDAFKHGNIAGTHPNGGVLIVAGDDHSGKSSTVAHQSEVALMHVGMPILAPSNVQDVIDFGLLGFAMSRYTGLYTGFKLCNETLEQTMTVEIGAHAKGPVFPDRGELPPEGIHNVATHVDRQRSEVVAKRYRWPLVEKFVRANGIDRVLIDAPVRKLGIVATGKAVQDVLQALKLLHLDAAGAAGLGISFYKLGCMFPVEREGLSEFAAGQAELLFVEEKEGLTENQAKTILYGRANAPLIVGKTDEDGTFMIPSDVQLEPIQLAIVIAERLRRLAVAADPVYACAKVLAQQMESVAAASPAGTVRTPYFCSGCPHNTGTRKPDGSYAAGGIGCHAMAMYSDDKMLPNTQMGGEGGHWYSLAKFSDMPHIFQNMGDGTYYHSGLLAVRGAVAAKVNITFKILFNDAVAMTGGQPVDGPLSVGDITRQVLAEGAVRCVVVTDNPGHYGSQSGLEAGVTVHHRDDYDSVQRTLREIKGVTVIVYEQTCAAEKRRRRKRGTYPDPAKRMFINSDVCEGCGDCSVKSNCVSVWPKETELGRKRQIDQSSCNKDYSCVKGFCPSFVTVLGAEPRKPERTSLSGDNIDGLPVPAIATLNDGVYNIMVSGIGGTGVVTVGALLAMAAHLEGKACSTFDMTGLSQKNGAVYSHVRIGAKVDDLGAQKLGIGEAHLALAFDAVAALSKEAVNTLAKDKSAVVVNARITPTPAFQRNPDLQIDQPLLVNSLGKLVGDGRLYDVDATGLGLALLGDSIAANLFMLGYASQKGLLPVSPEALGRAIEINAVSVEFNKTAFALGRLLAADPDRLEQKLVRSRPEPELEPLSKLEDILAHRVALLSAYQNPAYAQRYQRLVEKVASAEARIQPGSTALAVAVARNFAKLMAYKDEYEVGRLYSLPSFKQQLKENFAGEMKLRYNLAPPLFAKRDPLTGQLVKREFGSWVGHAFGLLARLKFLRGTAFDVFGYTEERRMERGLIDDYEAQLTMMAGVLTASNHAAAVEFAGLPAQIRGFGHIKEANVKKVRQIEPQILAKFRNPAQFASTAVKFVPLQRIDLARETQAGLENKPSTEKV